LAFAAPHFALHAPHFDFPAAHFDFPAPHLPAQALVFDPHFALQPAAMA
jgi:hypothetical protein